MKTLFVLRHGKSDWHAGASSDHERPLADRGVAAAELIGRFLSQRDQVPAKVISSTAVRARDTANLAMKAGEWKCAVSYTDSLYGASVAAVLEVLAAEDDALPSILLVGHQPTWSELIASLTGGTSVRLPTAALARIDFEVDRWEEVDSGGGTLRWLVTPKLLQATGGRN